MCEQEFSTLKSQPQKTCSAECGRKLIRVTRQMEVERQFGKPIRQLLIEMYHEQKLSIDQISRTLEISDHTIWDWFKSLSIPRRGRSEAVALQWVDNDERKKATADVMRRISAESLEKYGPPTHRPEIAKKISIAKTGKGNHMYGRLGADNPLWKGGKVTYRGKGWRSIRTIVIRRDGSKCQICGSKKQLQVHHITPYRYTQDNSLKNLITLCAKCHRKAETGKIAAPMPLPLE